MSQVWISDVYTGSTVAATTLGNMESMFATLRSNFSGGSQPSNNVAGNDWYDTTQKVRKTRDYGNSAWFGLFHGDTSQKLWIYRNAAMEGYAVDSTPTDRVLALKGGTTYTTGGAGAGSWDLSHTHTGGNHTLTIAEMPAHTHTTPHGSDKVLGYSGSTVGANPSVTGSTGGGGSHNHGTTSSGLGSTPRLAASVGTLQYLDL